LAEEFPKEKVPLLEGRRTSILPDQTHRTHASGYPKLEILLLSSASVPNAEPPERQYTSNLLVVLLYLRDQEREVVDLAVPHDLLQRFFNHFEAEESLLLVELVLEVTVVAVNQGSAVVKSHLQQLYIMGELPPLFDYLVDLAAQVIDRAGRSLIVDSEDIQVLDHLLEVLHDRHPVHQHLVHAHHRLLQVHIRAALSDHSHVLPSLQELELLQDLAFLNLALFQLFSQLNVQLLLLAELSLEVLIDDFGDMPVVCSSELALQVAHEFDLVYQLLRQ